MMFWERSCQCHDIWLVYRVSIKIGIESRWSDNSRATCAQRPIPWQLTVCLHVINYSALHLFQLQFVSNHNYSPLMYMGWLITFLYFLSTFADLSEPIDVWVYRWSNQNNQFFYSNTKFCILICHNYFCFKEPSFCAFNFAGSQTGWTNVKRQTNEIRRDRRCSLIWISNYASIFVHDSFDLNICVYGDLFPTYSIPLNLFV